MIGAPRSGTTSLYEYLNAHPQVFMSSVKEPEFFSAASLDGVRQTTPDRGARSLEEDAALSPALHAELPGTSPSSTGPATRRSEARRPPATSPI